MERLDVGGRPGDHPMAGAFSLAHYRFSHFPQAPHLRLSWQAKPTEVNATKASQIKWIDENQSKRSQLSYLYLYQWLREILPLFLAKLVPNHCGRFQFEAEAPLDPRFRGDDGDQKRQETSKLHQLPRRGIS